MVDNNLNRLNQVFENLHTGSFCRNALLFEAVIRYQTIYASAEGNNTMAKQKDKDIRAIRNAMDKASQEKMAFHDDLHKKLRENRHNLAAHRSGKHLRIERNTVANEPFLAPHFKGETPIIKVIENDELLLDTLEISQFKNIADFKAKYIGNQIKMLECGQPVNDHLA